MSFTHLLEASRWKKIAIQFLCTGLVSCGLAAFALAQSASAGFAVLSSSDVTLKNRVNIKQSVLSPTVQDRLDAPATLAAPPS
jgi:hypothetical protein